MSRAAELELQAVVGETLLVEPRAGPDLGQELDRAVLEHAGADASLHMVARACFQHDRLDPLEVEQVGEHETGRPGADDHDLRPLRPTHAPPSSARTSCAIANAEFAAGTPQ